MERGLLTVTKARPCSYYARARKSSLHRGMFEFQPFNVIKKWYMFLRGKKSNSVRELKEQKCGWAGS